MSTNPYWIGPHPERKTHMNNSNLNVVTGAFSYTGKYIASKPTFPIWLNIPLSKSSAFFKPLSICETLAVGMAIITP